MARRVRSPAASELHTPSGDQEAIDYEFEFEYDSKIGRRTSLASVSLPYRSPLLIVLELELVLVIDFSSALMRFCRFRVWRAEFALPQASELHTPTGDQEAIDYEFEFEYDSKIGRGTAARGQPSGLSPLLIVLLI